MKRRRGRTSAIAQGAESPVVRTLAASAALAAGVGAVEKLATARGNRHEPAKDRHRYRLEPDETPKQGVSRVARGELDLTIGLLREAPQGDSGPEAIHEARKSLKRLRTLLRVNRPALGERRYQRENMTFRDAGRGLSDARDAQVLLETLDSLQERFATKLPAGTWGRLRTDLAAGAERAQGNGPSGYDDVLGVLSTARRRVTRWPAPSEDGSDSLVEGFDRIYRKGRRALRRAKKDPTPENFHELRKRGKDLWHAAQLLEPARPARMKKLAKGAHRLSDLLGEDHDHSVLLEYADQHPELLDKAERGLLQRFADRRRDALRRQAIKCAESLYGRKPKRMLARLSLA